MLLISGGKRKGAGTCALPVWHNDIEDFLDIQTEVGDARSKSFDIQPQVTIPDLFMQKLLENKYQRWFTFCPYEVKTKLGLDIGYLFNEEFNQAYYQIEEAIDRGILKVVTEHRINDLWIHILKVAFERGRPYVAFIDKINRDNPNKHDGVIFCFNLCIESFSNTLPDVYAHTCSLASLVVGRVPINKLSEKASSLTRLLDNCIDLTVPPIEESANHMRDYRTIGIGIQGMVDLLAREFKSYEDLDFITEVAERIQYGFVKESIQLAIERGPYPKFKGSQWDTGEIFDKFIANSVCPDLNWHELKSLCKIHGIRNSQGTSPAPNCQDPTNPVQIYEGDQIVSKNLYEIFELFNIDVTDIEKDRVPQWIDLPSPLKVPTYEGDDTVTRIWYNEYSEEVVEIEFEDGEVYTYTPNHKLLVLRNNESVWVMAGELTEEDEVLTHEMVNVTK